MFSSIFLKSFCWIHLKLDLQAHWRYFCRRVKDRPQRPKFLDIQMSKKIQVLEYFVKKFPLDSHHSCFICSLELLSQMCTIWASNAQFLGHFGPQRKSKFWCQFGHFLKKFSLASNQYCFTCSLQWLLDVWRIWASEAQFLGPKMNINSGLWSFSKKYFYWFRISLRAHVNLSYF